MLCLLLCLDLVLPDLDRSPLVLDDLPLLVLLRDHAPLDLLVGLRQREQRRLVNALDLLVLLHPDELRLVRLEALDVLLLDLVLRVDAELVDSDAQEPGTRRFNPGRSELLLREPPAQADPAVVPGGWAMDERPKRALDRARSDLLRAQLAGGLAANLARRVVEERLHAPLPVLAEVIVRDTVVLADHGKGQAKPTRERFCQIVKLVHE